MVHEEGDPCDPQVVEEFQREKAAQEEHERALRRIHVNIGNEIPRTEDVVVDAANFIEKLLKERYEGQE
jgi:ferric-dicitrate binding protein FerR (iron transport regulator)